MGGAFYVPRSGLQPPAEYEIIRAGRRWREDRGTRESASNYNVTEIRNDLAAMRARENCAFNRDFEAEKQRGRGRSKSSRRRRSNGIV